MAKKSNWDRIREQNIQDSARYRDVYERQQLERSSMDDRPSMKSYGIFAVILGLLTAVLLWAGVALVEVTGVLDGLNAGWYKTVYKNDGADSVFQYANVVSEEPALNEDGTQVLDEAGNPVLKKVTTRYVWRTDTGVLIDITHGEMPKWTGCSGAYYDENGNLAYAVPMALTDGGGQEIDYSLKPDGTPAPRIFQVIDPALVEQGVVTDETTGEITSDYMGKTYELGYVFRAAAVSTMMDYDGEYFSGDELPVQYDITDPVALSADGFQPAPNGNYYIRLNRGVPEDTGGKMFHENFMDLRPTPLKLALSAIGFLAVFGLFYFLFKNKLKSAASLSDCSDINQHFDDQHIALPEEVQRAYDIFPDVGAHSSVMVSSMISHQMLSNRGLKKVQLAKRADKDILDEDGDVEVYKGDILRDEDGEPITTEVPIIDTKFSEALFDSAKVPKATRKTNYRRYFDATKIPYNPGNENLDKLKDFSTVAELINKDWTFPIYEPQRPGGIYIVDTAPVNTMVWPREGDLSRAACALPAL